MYDCRVRGNIHDHPYLLRLARNVSVPRIVCVDQMHPNNLWKYRIGNVDATVDRIDPYVVWSIQKFSIVIIYQHFVRTVRMYLPKLSVHICTCNEITIFIKCHSVGTTGSLEEQAYLTRSCIPLMNSVIGLISKKYISMFVNGGTFSESKTFSQSI